MSSTAAARRALPVRATPRSRPRLIVVASPRAAGKAPFIALVGALLLAGLLSLLMLHMLAAQDSFRQTSLQQRLASLTDTEQRLQQQVQLDSAPAALREKARALGMVPSVITHYRQLPNGRIVAHEVAVPLVTASVVTTTTTSNDANTAAASTAAASTAAAKNESNSSGSNDHGHHGAHQQ